MATAARRPANSHTASLKAAGHQYECMLEVWGSSKLTVDQCDFQHSRADGIRFFADSGGPISNSRFQNNAGYGLWLRGASPDVTDCTFANNTNVGRLESGDGKGSFPRFQNTTFTDSGYVHIASNIDSGGTLTAAPYYIDGHRHASAETTLTVEGGASFAMANFASFTVHGNLIANGSEDAPILFNRAGDNHWGAVRITNNEGTGEGVPSRLSHCIMTGGGYWCNVLLEVHANAPIDLDHCQFRESTADGVRFFENVTGAMTQCRFEDNAGYGLWLRGSSPAVDQSAFSGNGNAGRLESGAGQSSLPVFTQSTFEDGQRVHIAGNLETAGTLTAAPYYIDGHRYSVSTDTLTIEQGASFAMANFASWTIHGNLVAEGTEDAPIVFSRAGDNHWGAIRLTNNEGDRPRRTHRLTYCTFDGGGYWHGTLLEVYGGSPISLEQCTLRNSTADLARISNAPGGLITGCLFEGATSHGLRLHSSSPSISHSTFRDFGNEAILLLSSHETGASFPSFSGNDFGPTDYIEIGTNIDSSGTLTDPGQALPGDGHPHDTRSRGSLGGSGDHHQLRRLSLAPRGRQPSSPGNRERTHHFHLRQPGEGTSPVGRSHPYGRPHQNQRLPPLPV